MSLMKDLLAKPPALTTASKYTALNGVAYLVAGALLVVWPRVTQTLFMDPAFVGHEEALMRVIGLTIVVIGWFYLFGGRSGARQIVAASIIDRLMFVPVVLVPLATAGVPSFAYDVRDFGRVARHWRLGVAWSRMSALGH
jgi:predicted ABC-type sugar transport system permease subunit